MKSPKFRTVFPKLAAVILLVFSATSVVGCGVATPEPTPIPTATVIPPTATQPPTPIPTETPIPTATETPFIPKATIKIVSQSPLSGDQAIYGQDIARSAELAVDQLAGSLEELGYKIEFVAYDDQASIDIGMVNAKEIVADPQVLCGVGHFNSRVMINTSDLYHLEGLVFVSPSNTAPNVTERGYLEVNRLVGRDDGQGAAGALFAQAQGYTNIFVVRNDLDFARRNADAFKREASQLVLKVVGDFEASVEAGNYSAVIEHLMTANPDMVYFSGTADQAGAFFKQARLAGYTGTFLGTDENPALVETGGPLPIENGGLYYVSTVAQAGDYPDATEFIQNFNSLYGTDPQVYAAQAYDAAGICMKAIEEASRAKGGELPTREEVALAIRALQDFKGISGTYNFNEKGDPLPARYYVYQVVSADPANWGQSIIFASYDVAPPH